VLYLEVLKYLIYEVLLTKKSGVYKILCSCGKVYIGQMGHHISTRISEHIRDTRLED
jgi:hypothetical protein